MEMCSPNFMKTFEETGEMSIEKAKLSDPAATPFLEIIRRCVIIDPTKRPDASNVLQLVAEVILQKMKQ